MEVNRLTWVCLVSFLSTWYSWCTSHKCLVLRQAQDDCEALKDKSVVYRHHPHNTEVVYTLQTVLRHCKWIDGDGKSNQ